MKVGYKLKTPCSDCPFKKSSALHEGVMRDLPDYDSKLKRGEFAHTCHKTDSRSDGYVEQYNGEVQHCAGALIMMKKIEESQDPDAEDFVGQRGLLYALVNGFSYEDIPNDPEIFGSMSEMAQAYKPMLEKELKKTRVRVRYRDNRVKEFTL